MGGTPRAGTLTAGSHTTIARWRTIIAVVALALGVLLAWQVEGSHRAAALGSVLAAGAALAVVVALAVRRGVAGWFRWRRPAPS